MNTFFTIPAGKFASDDEALKKKREELKKSILEGKKIYVKNDGGVTTKQTPEINTVISPNKLASEDDAMKKKREELRKALLDAKKIYVKNDGSVTTQQTPEANTVISQNKLALNQWYEKDPGLLVAEKAAMTRAYPHFQLETLSDGRLAWTGSLKIGAMGDNSWYVMAVYNNNHPQQVMGSSVRVYLVEPDIQELIDGLGWQPHHLLRDSNNQLYLCTTEAKYVKTGKEVTPAATTITWAVKWLLAFELVLTGDLSVEKFNQHEGI